MRSSQPDILTISTSHPSVHSITFLSQTTTTLSSKNPLNMKFTPLALFGLAAMAFAQDNDNDDDDNDDSTSSSVAGVVYTSLDTTTDVGASTTLVPVVTPVVDTTTDVGVSTDVSVLSRTTDIGTTPTNTIVQFETTTDVGLQSGYAFTTNSAGSTVPTYTGTGTAPSLTATPTAAGGASSDDDNDDDNTTTATDTTTATTGTATDNAAPVMTAAPYFAAGALAGVMAFAI